ncbi:MAG: class I SAM-dependent methyltransferase [Thermaerobacterales bacterium]
MDTSKQTPERDGQRPAEPPQPRHPIFSFLYDFMTRGAEERMEPWRRRVCGEAAGRVLEIGAGTGLNFAHYDWDRIFELVAVEPDPHMARRARRRAGRLGLPVQIVGAPAEALPFPDRTFDTVTVVHVLCTVPDPARALGEIARVLKEDGQLRLLEHVRSDVPRLARWQDLIRPLWSFCGGGCRPNRDTGRSVEKAGFEWQEYEFFTFPIGPAAARPHIYGAAGLL